MNLSQRAVKSSRVTLFMMLLILSAGLLAYFRLGRLEDPEFTIKTALVVAVWPGATADEMQRQVIDILENHIQEMGQIDTIRAEARPGSCTIWVDIQEKYWEEALPQIWDELRRKVQAAHAELPPEVASLQVFDDFGDVFGIVLAVTNDGHPYREFRDQIDNLRRELLQVSEVARVELFGVQREQILLEANRSRMAAYHLRPDVAIRAIQAQNTIVTGGAVDIGDQRVELYPTGALQSLSDVANARLPAGDGESIRVRDVADVRREFVDPPRALMRFGTSERSETVDAIGMGISIVEGGNVIRMGAAVRARLAQLEPDLPVGIEIHTIADQPAVVEQSISEFTLSLWEAVAIVLVVLLIGLGLRVGVIVGFGVPLTILATFIWMLLLHIDLQRASLGALIIVLGMVVDNSIVVSDLILVKLRRGMPKLAAIGETFSQAAMPLAAATLVSVAAFMPIFLSPQSTGEYLRSLFQVVGIALGMSWLVAFTATSLNCHTFLHPSEGKDAERDPHDDRLHRMFRRRLEGIMRHRAVFLLVIVSLFVASVVGFGYVDAVFFPAAVRPQFTVQIDMPEGSRIGATNDHARRVEEFLLAHEGVESVATFVGDGVPRFTLTFSPAPSNPSMAQLMITTSDPSVNQGIMNDLREFIAETMPEVEPRIANIPMGPAFDYSIALRISGPDAVELRTISERIQAIMQSDPRCREVNDDWRNRVPAIVMDIDQYRAQRAGVTSADIAFNLEAIFSGDLIDFYREGTRRLPITVRASTARERQDYGMLLNTPITTGGQMGASIPLRQVASPRIEWYDARIQRRDKRQTIQPRCNVIEGVTADEVRRDLAERIFTEFDFEHDYPECTFEWGGEYEEATKSQGGVLKFFPAALGIMALVLIVKFNSFRRVAIFAYIPLCLIGVTAALLLFQQPFGFVALLGLMSLMGIMINNGIVLVDQIDQNTTGGMAPYPAVMDACVSRLRPIILSAATTVLGMLPLALSGPFWRPMAVVIMAGLTVGTVLTLGVVPVLYSLLFRVRIPQPERH